MENLMTLGMLTLLQAVLGFDNLLYISLEARRAPRDRQAFVRRAGIAIAMVLRIGLLFVLVKAIQVFQDPFLRVASGVVSAEVNGHSMIVLFGGVFILYTATKEIFHMLSGPDLSHEEAGSERTVGAAIAWIVAMNIVFSFDSILSALALTKVFWVMAMAIVLGALLMIWLSDRVAAFLERNRMYEVLGLFILFIVGIMLLSEGAHLADLVLFGHEITPMSKATFYFVLTVLVLVDVVQSRYQAKLMALQRAAGQRSTGAGA